MSDIEQKPKRVMTEEQKAKMKAGREAAKARRDAEKLAAAAAALNAFERKYYDGLRESYNVGGAEMENFFKIFKNLGCDHDKFMAYLRRDSPRIDWDRLIKSYWS